MVAVFAAGVAAGTFAVGGSDSFGYASQAEDLAAGRLRTEVPLARTAPWPAPEATLAPLGYCPATVAGAIVPTYSPGLPLAMAVARLAGGRTAMFLVVPFLGALLVGLTMVVGRRFDGPAIGLAAATLLACSPVFLYQLVQPMSDVPAAAWWMAATVLAARAGTGSAATAGLAASAAVLTRPNLAPLVLLVAALAAWSFRDAAAGARDERRPRGWMRAACVIAGAVPGIAAVAVWQAYLFGSPLRSGYGETDALFAWSNVGENLRLYPGWAVETQTPLVVLALVPPLVEALRPRAERRWRWIAFMVLWIGAVTAAYLVYAPFDHWSYLRFLLPAWPPLCVLMAAGWSRAVEWLPGRARVAVFALGVAGLAAWTLGQARGHGTFALWRAERRYRDVGTDVRARLPPRAIVFAVQEGGSVRFYAGLPTLRWDLLDPAWLDRSLDWLRAEGYVPYLLLDNFEEQAFRDRFRGSSAVGGLDWPPLAERGALVHLYDPADRARYLAGQGRPRSFMAGDPRLAFQRGARD